MKFYEREDFRALQRAWYDTLKSTGFEDAEIEVGGEFVLKQYASNAYRQAPAVVRSIKSAYFDILAHCVATCGKFDSRADELILTRRSEGTPIKEISAELKALGLKCHRQTVRFVIRRYEVKWDLRKYTPEQLTSNRKAASGE